MKVRKWKNENWLKKKKIQNQGKMSKETREGLPLLSGTIDQPEPLGITHVNIIFSISIESAPLPPPSPDVAPFLKLSLILCSFSYSIPGLAFRKCNFSLKRFNVLFFYLSSCEITSCLFIFSILSFEWCFLHLHYLFMFDV
jgi:hypothetical protein